MVEVLVDLELALGSRLPQEQLTQLPWVLVALAQIPQVELQETTLYLAQSHLLVVVLEEVKILQPQQVVLVAAGVL